MLLLLFLLLLSCCSFGVFGSGGDPVRVFVGQQLVSGFGSQTDPPQSGFRLIHEREVRTRDLTICVRYKGRILWNHIFNIKMVSYQMQWSADYNFQIERGFCFFQICGKYVSYGFFSGWRLRPVPLCRRRDLDHIRLSQEVLGDV